MTLHSLQAKREERQVARIIAGRIQQVAEANARAARRRRIAKDILTVAVVVAALLVALAYVVMS